MGKDLHITERKSWRNWLKENHDKSKELWLVYYKKHTGKARISYEDAVEEALCFGWIDSIVKKIDSEKFAQKFTPRKTKSKWSESNKRRAEKMIRQRRMTKAGLATIITAKENGEWNSSAPGKGVLEIPAEFKRALDKNGKANDYFVNLAPSYRKQFIGWIASAKKSETRNRRIEEAICHLERRQKLGMK